MVKDGSKTDENKLQYNNAVHCPINVLITVTWTRHKFSTFIRAVMGVLEKNQRNF